MFQKAIRDMQEHIKQHKIDLYQANVGATRISGENVFTTTFENKKFTKVNIIGLSYNNTPQCLRRYFDDENRMIKVPTEKAIEHLTPIIDEAWVQYNY